MSLQMTASRKPQLMTSWKKDGLTVYTKQRKEDERKRII